MNRYHKCKRANPSPNFSLQCKCKLCNTSFIASNDNNIAKVDILIERDPEEKDERVRFLLIFHRTDTYARDVFEQAILWKSECPNCGKKKKLFFSRYPKVDRKFTYGEWVIDHEYYDDCETELDCL